MPFGFLFALLSIWRLAVTVEAAVTEKSSSVWAPYLFQPIIEPRPKG